VSGWPIPQATTGGGGTVEETTATNTAITVTAREMFQFLIGSGAGGSGTTISTGAATSSAAGLIGAGLRTLQLTFPAGSWTITVNGRGRGNAVVSEVFVSAGAGVAVVGLVPFTSIDTNGIVNAAPSGVGLINVDLSDWLVTPIAPVAAFLKVVVVSEETPITGSDLTRGLVKVGGIDLASTYDVLYTYSLQVVQAAHGHTLAA
jgi:ribosomal protein S11